MNEKHFCMCPTPKSSGLGMPRAAMLDAYKWGKGAIVSISFLEGDAKLRERVEAVAREWTGRSMANIVFNFNTKDADVRIAFKAGDGSWSYIGTDCKQLVRTQPTMNYGWLSANSPDDELRRVVLHEFGHALGLIHEHQSPDHPINWNRDAVYKDLGGPPNNWDKATVDANIFKRYEPGQITGTPVDRDSIMMYPIPAAWTNDGFSVGLNGKLSDTDKKFIREAYLW